MQDLIKKLMREMDEDKQASYVKRVSHIMREEAAPATAIGAITQNFFADWGVTGIRFFRDGAVRIPYVDYDPSLVPKK
jgi:hypothetical protein